MEALDEKTEEEQVMAVEKTVQPALMSSNNSRRTLRIRRRTGSCSAQQLLVVPPSSPTTGGGMVSGSSSESLDFLEFAQADELAPRHLQALEHVSTSTTTMAADDDDVDTPTPMTCREGDTSSLPTTKITSSTTTAINEDEEAFLSPEFDFASGAACPRGERLSKQLKKLNRLSRSRDGRRVKKHALRASTTTTKKLQSQEPVHDDTVVDQIAAAITTTSVSAQEQFLSGVLSSLASEFSARFVSGAVDDRVLVKQIIAEESMQRADGCFRDPFFIVDLGRIVKKYVQFKNQLPRVRPFYAVKCNPSRAILKTISAMGGAFDCASSAEIMDVLSLSDSINPRTDIIFANPCKSVDDMRFAREQGVRLVTFDNEFELYKFAEHWPDASLVLRIITDDSHSMCQFSSKFGASMRDSPFLLATAKQLGLTVVGISFHVGSGCGSTDSYVKAVVDAHTLFRFAKQEFGFPMNLLDLGGGWPGTDDTVPSFTAITNAIRPIIDELFEPDVQLIAEPGRYFAAASHTLACNVSSKRAVNDPRYIRYSTQIRKRLFPEPVAASAHDNNVPLQVEDSSESESEPEPEREFLYYINDGVYGSFNCLFFDHAVINPLILDRAHGEDANSNDAPKYRSTIFGPTCDSLDCIAKRISMPELHVGDWLFFEAFGAYTSAAASAFNGFKTRKFHYIIRS